VDARPFPPDLVMPPFLAVTSARELDSGLPDRSGTMRVYDPRLTLLGIDVAGLARITVKRNPSS
jgi:hypothetical protein